MWLMSGRLQIAYFHLEDEKSISKAVSVFDKALRVDPDYPEALVKRGNCHREYACNGVCIVTWAWDLIGCHCRADSNSSIKRSRATLR